MTEAKEKYQVGDTILVVKGDILGPVQLVGFAEEKEVLVRRLARSRDYGPERKARTNETSIT